ncbi:O-antigen ligase family protein [Pedobacter metabolipauper]|uniref:O-antigen ligase-like membrane protein n=1 Tax=Pedobacter metabolipauper TaxID=425513 RepID=A0A4R6T1Q1_9SPHI|nr:O-antigen ligase family protein [Pedobacter metabolipauper]TDQ12009.1 O-antigen ligase-like membrane protein [Pedobacter metabolipauper]
MWSRHSPIDIKRKLVIIGVALAFSVIASLLTVEMGMVAVFVPFLITGALVFTYAVFASPRVGFIAYLIYCFIIAGLLKNTGLPFGPLMEVLLGFTWLSLLFHRSEYNWKSLKNDHCIVALIWFIINLIEVLNPTGASVMGWFMELRFTTMNWILIAPLAFLLFDRKKDLDLFIILIIGLSVLALVYGLKQMVIGVSPAEQAWLDDGGDFTHIVDGRLRIFSFYTDAGQFGASQAAMSVVAFILAMGPFKKWKRLLLGISGAFLFYGMLISGTRGALFALLVAAVFSIFLSKNFKVLIIGSIFGALFIGVLKYTTIGSGVYQIVRLRTALDPSDPSLNARFINQKKLAKVMSGLPFGGGVGVIGMNGSKYNKDNYLSKVPPDSYWVKIWVMYGVVGLVIWFSLIMYLIGKCSGIVWNIRDDALRVKCIALTSGGTGIFFCSYGNEVMNGFPSSVILYMSWSFVIMAPYLDDQIAKRAESAESAARADKKNKELIK